MLTKGILESTQRGIVIIVYKQIVMYINIYKNHNISKVESIGCGNDIIVLYI